MIIKHLRIYAFTAVLFVTSLNLNWPNVPHQVHEHVEYEQSNKMDGALDMSINTDKYPKHYVQQKLQR